MRSCSGPGGASNVVVAPGEEGSVADGAPLIPAAGVDVPASASGTRPR